MRTWDYAHAAVAAMVLTASMVLFFLLITSCSQSNLPHRPPTGNHGQGLSPQPTCPGQYRQPVEIDGHEFPLTCFGAASQFADVTGSPAVWSEVAIVVMETPDGKMLAEIIKVPSMSDFKALLCFSIQGRRSIECLYLGKTGQVLQRGVVPDEVNT